MQSLLLGLGLASVSTVAIFRFLTLQPSFLGCPSARPHSGGIALGRTKACRYYNATEFRSGSQDDKKERVFLYYIACRGMMGTEH